MAQNNTTERSNAPPLVPTIYQDPNFNLLSGDQTAPHEDDAREFYNHPLTLPDRHHTTYNSVASDGTFSYNQPGPSNHYSNHGHTYNPGYDNGNKYYVRTDQDPQSQPGSENSPGPYDHHHNYDNENAHGRR